MKKGIPLLGVASVLGMAVLTGGVVIDHTVQRLPDTTVGVQGSGPDGSGGQGTFDSSGDQGSSGSGLVGSIARLLGLQSASHDSTTVAGHGMAGSQDPNYRLMKIFGTNISGLEFSGLFQPNTEQTYAYFAGNGLNTVRIPFDWNEMQPDLYGDFDATSKQYLDDNIAWAKKHGQKIILDAHNYGRRYIYRDGGFSDDFVGGTQHTFQLPYGDQDQSAGTLTFRDFGRGVAGTFTNPVAPHAGYRTTFDMKVDALSGDAWNEFYMDVFYRDEANRYSLVANPVTHTWQLRQTVNGHETILASGSKNWTVGQYYHVEIDVNQAAAGKVNAAIDGVPLFATNSVSSTASLAHGKISMYPSGVKATIKDLTVNVGGDVTSGGPVERRLTENGLPLSAWQDFWTKLSNEYKNDPAIIAYDHNEPHDMPVPTVPANHSEADAAKNGLPLATTTAIGQSMLDAIRANGDDKFVVFEMDSWANTHRFEQQYGVDPEPWIKDTLPYSKVVYSGHFYFDSDHSGLYPNSSTPGSLSSVSAELEPFFRWCQERKQICYIGEFGVPNTPQWQPAIMHFLHLTKQYNIWWTQWAGGDIYSSPTTMQPTNSFLTDTLQMLTIRSFLDQ
ncbi:MAG TPA: cellulase family glycosylhydrolase [Candidatus Saccharimonadales bacterium]|nr:cellulase family glycosylhydrolase [Candidatus Saccharimonadales bacterium]